MADIWATIAASLAATIHTTPEAAGIMLGFGTLMVILVGFIILFAAMRITVTPQALFIPLILGLGFVGMTGWFPPWAVLLIVILAAAVIGKRYMDGQGD